MSNNLVIPHPEVGPTDEVGYQTLMAAGDVGGLPNLEVNYADNEMVLRQVQGDLAPLIDYVRRNRVTQEEEWRQIMRMEMMMHDGGRRYFGRNDTYLPVWSRMKRTLVSALSRGLFPSDDYMDVVDRSGVDQENAKAVKTYLQWEFERNAQMRSKIKPFLGQLSSLGNSVMKRWYKKQPKYEGRSVASGAMNKSTGVYWSNFNAYDGFAVSPRSMFYFYMWPTTAESIDDCTLVFEDIDFPMPYIADQVRRGKWLNGENALSAPTPDTHMAQMSELHNNLYGMSSPDSSPVSGNRLGGTRTITEAWTLLHLPPEAYTQDEDPSCPVPCMVLLAGGVPLVVRRNPHLEQRPPYEFMSTNAQPGMIYGYNDGRLSRPLQMLVNDFMNQTADVGNYVLNPVMKINQGMVSGPLRPLAPGNTYYLTDIDQGMSFERPPYEMMEYGMQIVSMLMGFEQELGGAPPQLSGNASGSKTATQAQIMQRNALAPLQDVVEDIELGVMVPMMRAAWLYAQQYRSDDVMIVVAGKSIRVTPEQLIIDPEFRWMASSQAINQAQRAQQAMVYLQGLTPLIPYLNQIGYVVDPAPLLQRVYSDGLGYRGFDAIVKPAMSGMMSPNMATGINPGVQQEQMNRVRSAVEQSPQTGSYNMDMAPGEGEEFMEVRSNADEIAANEGGNNGKY